jgi:hypothetical protein
MIIALAIMVVRINLTNIMLSSGVYLIIDGMRHPFLYWAVKCPGLSKPVRLNEFYYSYRTRTTDEHPSLSPHLLRFLSSI